MRAAGAGRAGGRGADPRAATSSPRSPRRWCSCSPTARRRDDAWAALLAHAHASGSMGFKAATSVCRGYTLLRRGELDDAEASLRDGIEELTLWDLGRRGPRRDRRVAGRPCSASAATSPARGASWRPSPSPATPRRPRATGSTASPSSCSPRSASRRRWPSPATRRSASRHLRAIDTPCALAPGARAAPPRPPRGGAGARRRGGRERPGAGARRRSWRGRCGSSARWSTRTGSSTCSEAVALAERSPARLEHAKALAALGAALRAARRPSEARDPLRQALELADALGAERARDAACASELYAAGGRPRTTALQGPRRADAVGAARRRARRRRPDQPRDRRGAVRHAQDRRAAPAQRLPQARRAQPARPRRAARAPGLTRSGLVGLHGARAAGSSRRTRRRTA